MAFEQQTMKNPKLSPRLNSISPLLLFLAFGYLASCNNIVRVPESPFPISDDAFSVDTLARGYVIPYGIVLVGNDEYYLTDRIGKMYHLKDGNQTEVSGMPEVATFGTPGIPAIMHGGLMDLSLHPHYVDNSWIYMSYLAADGFAKISRFKVQGNTAIEFENIFTTRTQQYTGNGMRIVWEDDTHFFFGVGNSDFSTQSNPLLYAQDLNDDAGKIHRLRDDGSIPEDNPILEGFTAPTTIWSYGHRDVQGLVLDKSTNTLYGLEHGPKGGDELNFIVKGGNYGWPLFSYGINYYGEAVSTISEEEARETTILPERYWTVPTHDGGQAIAPACLLKVDGSNIAAWNGHFLIGSLAYRRLFKYDFENNKTYGLKIEGRVRTLKQLPSGDILALVERNDTRKSNGYILRLREK